MEKKAEKRHGCEEETEGCKQKWKEGKEIVLVSSSFVFLNREALCEARHKLSASYPYIFFPLSVKENPSAHRKKCNSHTWKEKDWAMQTGNDG